MSPSLIFTPNVYVKVCCNVSYIIKVVFFVHVYRVLHHYLSLHVVQKNLRFECVHILHYTFLLLFMQTSSLSKFEVLGALSNLTDFASVDRKKLCQIINDTLFKPLLGIYMSLYEKHPTF